MTDSKAALGAMVVASACLLGCDKARTRKGAAMQELPGESVTSGKAIHLRVLASYPALHSFYLQPVLWNALRGEPLAVVALPLEQWEHLGGEDRASLQAYAESLVPEVRSAPFRYSTVPESAPVAPTIRQRVARMTAESWGILAGSISADGRDIMVGRIVARGR